LHFLPQTFLIDRDGKITRTVVGSTTKPEFESLIRQALPNPRAGIRDEPTGLYAVHMRMAAAIIAKIRYFFHKEDHSRPS